MAGLGFKVEDLGFKVEDLGLKVEDLGLWRNKDRYRGLGLEDLGFVFDLKESSYHR